MKRTIITWSLIALAGLGCVIFIALALFYTHKKTGVPAQPAVTFPNASSTGGTGGSGSVILLPTRDGRSIAAKDFVNNGETIPDVENPGVYQLAGSLGYCLPDIKCAAASTPDFNIIYNSSDKSFTVALLTEPLGAARLKAEDFLVSRLGISKQDLCNLTYYVGTTYQVNENFSGDNLGFSVCDGATKLP